MKIAYTTFATSAGWMGALATPAGIWQTILPQKSREMVRLLLGVTHLRPLAPEPGDGAPVRPGRGQALLVEETPDSPLFRGLPAQLASYFDGQPIQFAVPLDLDGATEFQKKVWRIARTIEYGQTRTYGWIARQLGRPEAARAVGNAMGQNPVPPIVPCHRVMRSDGGLGGFSSGIELKKLMLRLEGRPR